MRERYPAIEPQQHGMLAAGDGHDVYWEVCGNPAGKPALVLHGGPGSGCKPWHRQMFDPERYRVVLLDQRGCGRSTPSAGTDLAALEANTTPHLLDDIEAVRELLEIDRWLVWGGSFGCELALAYAERYPARVSELVLWGITTGRRSEADWLFRGGVGVMFPEQWYRFADGGGRRRPGRRVPAAAARPRPGGAPQSGGGLVRMGVGDPGLAARPPASPSASAIRSSRSASHAWSPTTCTTISGSRTAACSATPAAWPECPPR